MKKKRKRNCHVRDNLVRFEALRTWEEVAEEATRRGMPITTMGAFKVGERALKKLRKAFADNKWIEIKV